MPKRDKLIVHMNFYHSFTLRQKFWPLKKFAFFGNQWKVAIYTGCQNNFIVKHPAHSEATF